MAPCSLLFLPTPPPLPSECYYVVLVHVKVEELLSIGFFYYCYELMICATTTRRRRSNYWKEKNVPIRDLSLPSISFQLIIISITDSLLRWKPPLFPINCRCHKNISHSIAVVHTTCVSINWSIPKRSPLALVFINDRHCFDLFLDLWWVTTESSIIQQRCCLFRSNDR